MLRLKELELRKVSLQKDKAAKEVKIDSSPIPNQQLSTTNLILCYKAEDGQYCVDMLDASPNH
jgi:hypothetical protein